MIPIVEEMWCKNCDKNPIQTVMEGNDILCGFCGKVIYTYTEEDIVKDWHPGWSQELRDLMNGITPLQIEISRMDDEGGSQPQKEEEE